ncbi:hypothetical protein N8K70_03060 [Microbacterium betulae]|uniref:DoxX family protein n=1 Tax=Microbacterium betulae TaxID=2981139 RepID=A0AA97FJ42_9MICO|nr:hypothetical protein [Microbacterium sp. AB]WOF23673.1 hypothetical protein N8K70_03060 [Microbacterium sp. AB]
MRASTAVLAALLAAAGALHLARPRIYEPIVPDWVPGTRRQVVVVSGAAEVLLAAALLPPRTRRLAAAAVGVFFVAVFPGNVESFRRARSRRGRVIAALRLPLQAPLVWWAVHEARRR